MNISDFTVIYNIFVDEAVTLEHQHDEVLYDVHETHPTETVDARRGSHQRRGRFFFLHLQGGDSGQLPGLG